MNNKKRVAKWLCIFIAVLSAGIPSYAKDIKVNYSYEEEAVFGEMRYVAQISKNEFYYDDYWGEYAPYSSNECGTACISMALSYLGIDETPKELGDYWIQRGYTRGVPFSTVFSDVPRADGGHSYNFFEAYERYENEEGVSPVIIYLSRTLNPYQSGNRHFVLVTDCLGDGIYSAVDPASSDRLTVKIVKDENDTLLVSLTAKNGTELSGEMTEYELCSAQYYIDVTVNGQYAYIDNKPAETESELVNEATPAALSENSAGKQKVTEKVNTAEEVSDKEEISETVLESGGNGLRDKTPYSTAAKKIAEAIRLAVAE